MTLIFICFRIKNIYFIKQILNECHTKLKLSPCISLVHHILTTFPERVSPKGIIDVERSDHQLIYYYRKLSHIKPETYKQITFLSLKNYTAEAYKEALSKVYFSKYENFGDMNKAYENLFKNG